jgi:glycosyltransferase involved in cell wall biosynthesis
VTLASRTAPQGAPGSSGNDKLRIAILGYRSNPYSGGQGIYIHYLSKALIAAGHEVDVISGPPYPELVDGVRLIKLPSLDLHAHPNHVRALRPGHLKSFADTFEYFSMLTGGFPEPYTFGRRLVRHFNGMHTQYDIVHDNQSLCYGTLELQRRGIPMVTTIHHPITSDLALALDGARDWKHRLLVRRWHTFIGMQKKVARNLNHVITVSEQSRRDIAGAFGLDEAKVSVVHNGIDVDTFRPMQDVERNKWQIMATASSDQPLKGLKYLILAVNALRDKYPELRVKVLGRIKEDGDIDRLIDSLGIRDRLTFISGVDTSEIVRMYAESSVVVVPSIYEGFGFPAGEAMACGVPVISTDGGALPEVVGDACYMVPVRDADAIAKGIVYLVEHPEERERLAAAGQERIHRLFSWQVAADRMIDHYRAVLAKSRAA